MSLESIGADVSVHRLFQPYAARGLLLARVAVSQRDRYQLLTEAGELTAEASGSLWYRTPNPASMPVTGDWVATRVVGQFQAIVEAVLPRKTVFSRRAVGRREDEQPVAANVDLVFLVCGLDGDFNVRRLERYLALASESGAEAVVVLNKADLCPDLEKRLAETAAAARGAPIIPATTKTPGGLDGIRAFLAYGRTVALLGSSGVGKSAIVNCLLGEQRFRTNEVRESDSRGRHTTTRGELIPLVGGGALIDTPGMRELQLWAGPASVDRTFDEVAEIASACRFRDCGHAGEDGCAVARAIAEGVVSEERWKSYRKLIAEAKRHAEITDRIAAAESKRRVKAIHKRMRAFYRQKGS
jgi:ribosome biogenesis GTPase / thiamine phosphate phosphatase